VRTLTYRGREFVLADGQVFDPAVADQFLDTIAASEETELTLDRYQEGAAETAIYPGAGAGQLIYPIVGLLSETGELADLALEQLMALPAEIGAPDYPGFAAATLRLGHWIGRVADLVKKAFRNDPQGVMTPDRRAALNHAIDGAERAFRTFRLEVGSDRIEFPRLPGRQFGDDRFVKEVGDALYYVARIAAEAGITLGKAGQLNYDKLKDRAARGVLRATGDDR
jgi:hypothetical protein